MHCLGSRRPGSSEWEVRSRSTPCLFDLLTGQLVASGKLSTVHLAGACRSLGWIFSPFFFQHRIFSCSSRLAPTLLRRPNRYNCTFLSLARARCWRAGELFLSLGSRSQSWDLEFLDPLFRAMLVPTCFAKWVATPQWAMPCAQTCNGTSHYLKCCMPQLCSFCYV